MKKISLFIAMSLDGYIADNKGSVNWLVGQSNEDNDIDSYSEFVKDIDTVIMGWNTYHQIVTELSPDEWVYDDFTTYVVTHNSQISSDKIHFTDKNPVELVRKLRKENGKGIWICGGANLIQQLVSMDMFGESTDGHKYGTPYQVVKRINPNSREDMELLREVLKNSRFDNADE